MIVSTSQAVGKVKSVSAKDGVRTVPVSLLVLNKLLLREKHMGPGLLQPHEGKAPESLFGNSYQTLTPLGLNL